MSAYQIQCNFTYPDGNRCTLMLTYRPRPIPGLLKIDNKIGVNEKEVVYLTCDNGHTCRYEI